jgi:hypothetical protein
VAGWTEAGELQPTEDGTLLEIGDLVVTGDDLDGWNEPNATPGGEGPTPVDTLEELLNVELLCQEALTRGVVSGTELPAERDRIEAELLQKIAEQFELRRLRDGVTDEELELFVSEFPRRVAVPGKVRAHVVAFGYRDADAFEAFVRARDLVSEARRGGDLSRLARELAKDLNLEVAEDTALLPPRQLVTYSPEVAQAISQLHPGDITDVVRLAPNRIRLITGAHDGALVVARLIERLPERRLELSTEADELRRRYWKRFGSEIVGQRQADALSKAGFELLESQ